MKQSLMALLIFVSCVKDEIATENPFVGEWRGLYYMLQDPQTQKFLKFYDDWNGGVTDSYKPKTCSQGVCDNGDSFYKKNVGSFLWEDRKITSFFYKDYGFATFFTYVEHEYEFEKVNDSSYNLKFYETRIGVEDIIDDKIVDKYDSIISPPRYSGDDIYVVAGDTIKRYASLNSLDHRFEHPLYHRSYLDFCHVYVVLK